MTTTVGRNGVGVVAKAADRHRSSVAMDEMHLTAVEEALDAEALATLATGVLRIPPSKDHYFVLTKPKPDDTILPLPHPLSETYSLKWANPTRIGGGAGVAYSLDVIAGIDEPAPARTRHLYITYMEEAGPSRCRSALASAIQQLGPILYTAEADARECLEADEELRRRAKSPPLDHMDHMDEDSPAVDHSEPMEQDPHSE